MLPLQTDKAGLARFATAVSTPGSPEYGQFESIPALVRRFGAPAGERAQVLAYLRRTGATGVKIDGSGLFADATMSVGLAQRLFGADLANFRTATPRLARFIAPTDAVAHPAGSGRRGHRRRRPRHAPAESGHRDAGAGAAGRRDGLSGSAPISPGLGLPAARRHASGCAGGAGPAAASRPTSTCTAYGYEGLYPPVSTAPVSGWR